jgi:hypothetical protein
MASFPKTGWVSLGFYKRFRRILSEFLLEVKHGDGVAGWSKRGGLDLFENPTCNFTKRNFSLLNGQTSSVLQDNANVTLCQPVSIGALLIYLRVT